MTITSQENPQETASPQETAQQTVMPTPEVLAEAMQPKLSDDEFLFKWREKIDGKYVIKSLPVTIMPLVVEHQNRFTKAVGSFMDGVSFSIENQKWMSAISDTVIGAAVLPQLVRILAENDEVEITDEMMAKCTLQPADMLDIVKRYSYKNEAIGGPIKNFFENVWPPIRQNVSDALRQNWSKITSLASKEEASESVEAEKSP